jgi:hypothetical protein
MADPPVPVTWVPVETVAAEVGVPVTTAPGDARLVDATAAANAFCFRRRAASGYVDDPTVSPGADIDEGVVFYAAALYRMKGAVDGFASFAEWPNQAAMPPGTLGQVFRLLGVPRPVVA